MMTITTFGGLFGMSSLIRETNREYCEKVLVMAYELAYPFANNFAYFNHDSLINESVLD